MVSLAMMRFYRGVYDAPSHSRYALPIGGRTFRGIDQYADYNKMYADYMRNVGRKIKYPSIRDPRANAGTSFSNAIGAPLKTGLKTFRWFV